MDSLPAKKKTYSAAVILLTLCCSYAVNASDNFYTLDDNSAPSYLKPIFSNLDVVQRAKRDAAAPAPVTEAKPPVVDANAAANATDDSNRTVNVTSTTAAVAAVTQIPLLGRNGTGILRVNITSGQTPRVSDPIFPDDNITTDVFKETPEMMKAEQNITDLKYDNHNFYNSTFIGNQTYFDEYWANITKQKADVHATLSNSHRRATTSRLSFDFPFYGHNLRNITVATGGFIYTGEHVHNWLAATQYIAPLMANFDTTLTNDSYVKMYDDGEKFTAFWENVTLQEDTSKKFTFAVTLYKNGDIVFAYKTIPLAVQNINDTDHPVKVGISDAYLTDRILFLVRRKTIYEYHRVSFKNYEIKSGTILRLTALPTCLQYDSCETCVNHDTGFDCMWCEAIHKCSSGTDRNKQDWMLRNCDKVPISNETACPARASQPPASDDGGSTAYVTDSQHPYPQAVVNTMHSAPAPPSHISTPLHEPVRDEKPAPAHSPIGGVVAAFVAVALVASIAAWTLYAFKNPHTRSGQLLIKYRPSQWSWRRGEARYTAATIHM
ncbi:plexin domain-containing protein 2 [Pectinophora gossypiella]|nr:plexin domain-containing protein 2 [Pectinophora gossypiella]